SRPASTALAARGPAPRQRSGRAAGAVQPVVSGLCEICTPCQRRCFVECSPMSFVYARAAVAALFTLCLLACGSEIDGPGGGGGKSDDGGRGADGGIDQPDASGPPDHWRIV